MVKHLKKDTENQKPENQKSKAKKKRRFTLDSLITTLLCICIALLCLSVYAYKNSDKIEADIVAKNYPKVERTDVSTVTTVLPSALTKQNSEQVLVNKTYTLPQSFVPSNLTTPYLNSTSGVVKLQKNAGNQAKKMMAKASADGIKLYVTAGYRSYDDQNTLFNSMVSVLGGENAVSKVCPRAGMSEHQTGLAVDFTNDPKKTTETEKFADTDTGKWLFQHAHEYGFILRYPKEKENITGYNYAPWHYRYVGVDAASKIWNSSKDHNTTFEEYYNIQ